MAEVPRPNLMSALNAPHTFRPTGLEPPELPPPLGDRATAARDQLVAELEWTIEHYGLGTNAEVSAEDLDVARQLAAAQTAEALIAGITRLDQIVHANAPPVPNQGAPLLEHVRAAVWHAVQQHGGSSVEGDSIADATVDRLRRNQRREPSPDA